MLAKRLEEIERRSDIEPGVTKILPIATETAAGVLALGGYSHSGPRLAALTWGAEDLSVALGAAVNVDERGDWLPPYQLARSLCLLAAAAAGVAAIDTPYTDFRDAAGLARQAAAARRDGFTGKLAIHPAQVDIINEAFRPDAQEVAAARRIVAAFDAAAGVGVVALRRQDARSAAPGARAADAEARGGARRARGFAEVVVRTARNGGEAMSFLRKVDHITYACAPGTIEKWAWFHMEVEGGRLIERIDDVRPHDAESSMKLWCIDYGEFGIALVEGIDRSKKSQVTKFVERHGDHACQHVAFDCHDLQRFRKHLLEMGGHPRGEVLVRHDGFGVLKQMFAKGYAEGDAAEASFPEYVERPRQRCGRRAHHVLGKRGPRLL